MKHRYPFRKRLNIFSSFLSLSIPHCFIINTFCLVRPRGKQLFSYYIRQKKQRQTLKRAQDPSAEKGNGVPLVWQFWQTDRQADRQEPEAQPRSSGPWALHVASRSSTLCPQATSGSPDSAVVVFPFLDPSWVAFLAKIFSKTVAKWLFDEGLRCGSWIEKNWFSNLVPCKVVQHEWN